MGQRSVALRTEQERNASDFGKRQTALAGHNDTGRPSGREYRKERQPGPYDVSEHGVAAFKERRDDQCVEGHHDDGNRGRPQKWIELWGQLPVSDRDEEREYRRGEEVDAQRRFQRPELSPDADHTPAGAPEDESQPD